MATTSPDLLSLLPDHAVSVMLLPLLGARDLCCLSRTCTRLRALCTAPVLWSSVCVRGDRQALLLTRASFLRNSVHALDISMVTDASFSPVVAFLGPSLACLMLHCCPLLTDCALYALALLRAALEAVADQRELQQRLHDSAAMRSTQAGQAALMAEAHAQAEQAAIEKLERELQGYRDQLQRYQQEVETQRGLQSKAAAESAEALVRAQAASNQEAVIDREIQTVGKQAAILGTAMATRDLCALTPAVMPLVLAELGLGRLSAGFVAQKMSACAIVESATEELVHLGLHDMMECKYLVNALCTIEACGVLGLSQAAIESHVGSSELTGASLEALGAAMWKAEQVQQWLVSKGIEEGEAAKVSSGIGGEHLLHLDAKDLQSLGVSALGDRKRVAREIKQLRKRQLGILGDCGLRSLTLACSGPSLCGILGHLPATLETLRLVRVPPELPDDAQDAPQQPLAFPMLRSIDRDVVTALWIDGVVARDASAETLLCTLHSLDATYPTDAVPPRLCPGPGETWGLSVPDIVGLFGALPCLRELFAVAAPAVAEGVAVQELVAECVAARPRLEQLHVTLGLRMALGWSRDAGVSHCLSPSEEMRRRFPFWTWMH
eukprot:m51a1_g7967 hypothetical protein (609) ;mRNA; r:249802-255261